MTENFNPEEKLVRACYPSWLKRNGKVTAAAFAPRERNGKLEGISVTRTHTRTLDETIKDMKPHFRPRSPFAYIVVSACQEIGVYIKYSPSEGNKYHSELYSKAPDIPLTPEERKYLADAAKVYIANVENA